MKLRILSLFIERNFLFIKFLLVGLVNAAFGYGVYLTFLYFGFNFAASAFISTVLGIIFNFFTTGRLVFESKKNSLFFKFFLMYGVIYLVTLAGLTVLNRIGISYEVGGAVMIIPNALLAFFLNKNFIFKK